jgi:carboxylesterase
VALATPTHIDKEATVAQIPGAEAFHHDGGPVGVLLCHGFTGNPGSLRPWGEHLAGAGFTVSLPCLPGHGTRWQDMQLTTWADWYHTLDRAFVAMSQQCEQVFLAGLSMGGALALRLAQRHADAVSGLVLVNPAVVMDDKRLLALPLVKRLVPSLAGICDDIKKPGVTEGAYPRTPLKALHSMVRGLREVRAELPRVNQPVVIYRSPQDHVVSPASGKYLLSHLGSTEVEERLCENSYHVATVDNDAEMIFAGSVEFITARAAGPRTPRTATELGTGAS